jgi:hypothetical protein
MLSALISVLALSPPFAHLRAPAPVMMGKGDPVLNFKDVVLQLCEALPVEEKAEGRSELLCTLYTESIAPLLGTIYDPIFSQDRRVGAVQALSKALDRVEEAACGPLLAGREPTLADATMFPAVAAFELTLPEHFGWTEWTNEALFYRRPRLHAWYELLSYERPVRDAAELVATRVAKLDLAAVGVEVPTAKQRVFPKHTW